MTMTSLDLNEEQRNTRTIFKNVLKKLEADLCRLLPIISEGTPKKLMNVDLYKLNTV